MMPILFAFPGTGQLAEHLRARLVADEGVLQWRHFPDNESLLALDGDCKGRDVVFVCTLRDPDGFALPLLFAARTARELGAHSVGLVAPYLAYMRQDARFDPGEAIASLHFASFLSWTFDWLVTVDPHLHRHRELSALFRIPAADATAMPAISEWIRSNVKDPILIGPDEESAQWVRRLGVVLHAPVLVLSKQRRGDRDVEVSAPPRDVLEGRTPVIVDDIISSGRTLVEVIARLRASGSTSVVCIAVHAVFGMDANQHLVDAGAGTIITTNTIPHPTNAIDDTSALVPAILGQLDHVGRGTPVQ
jgi:ribose-phosphate pyrophosphokinase